MCPVCKEPLVAFELEGVEVDACVVCRGIWLDAGELELIGELEGVPRGELSRALAGAKGGRRGTHRCPRCGRRLAVIQVGETRAVDLDRCPAGHGFWLDQGEVEALIGSFNSGEGGAVARFLRDFSGRDRVASGGKAKSS